MNYCQKFIGHFSKEDQFFFCETVKKIIRLETSQLGDENSLHATGYLRWVEFNAFQQARRVEIVSVPRRQFKL